MSEYYSFIYDVEELKYFYDNILPDLNPTEVYFVSLSARKKYLTEEEIVEYQLGRTEMFCKSLIRKREWDRFLRTIRKFECHKGGYTTKNGKSIPEKSIVVYININPSSTLQAIAGFKKVLAEYEVELASMALLGKRGDIESLGYRLNKIDNNLYTEYQQSRGKKVWIDIDMDIDKGFKIYKDKDFKKFLKEKKINTYYFIDTKSGYHMLIKKDELKFNPKDIIDRATELYEEWHFEEYGVNVKDFEIIINRNEMLCVPGTLQGGYPVIILNK